MRDAGQTPDIVGTATAVPALGLGPVFAAVPVQLVVFDRAFRIVDATDAYLAVAGRPREELVGRLVFDAFPDPPDDPESDGVGRLRASLERVLERGVPDTMELQKYNVQDPVTGVWHERWWEPLNVPVHGLDGEITHVIQRVEEVTEQVLRERREAQNARTLRSSMEQLEAAQRMARLGSWEYRLDPEEITISDGLRHLLGLRADETFPAPDADLHAVHPDDRAAVREQLRAAITGAFPADVEYRMRTDDAELVVQRRCVPVREHGVVVAVRATIQDITELKRLEAERSRLLAELEILAATDELTALPNRRTWAGELRREIARASRERAPLAVALVDLDRFKEYNDAQGHQAGDTLLISAAAAWRAVLRETDVLARVGGDEFALALPRCPEDRAHDLLRRLAAATPSDQSVSAGVAMWEPGESADDLLARADAALYAAKQAGRDCIRAAPRA